MLIPIGFLGGGAPASSYELISTTLLGSDTASVTFDVSTLASTYKHLQIRAVDRSAVSGTEDSTILRFNSDTASNYTTHFLFGNGSSVSTSWADGASMTRIYPWAAMGNTAASNVYGVHVIDILDPFSTTKYKTTKTLAGYSDGSTNRIALASGNWRSTSAITAISFAPGSANWKSGSRFSIYGIKGA